MENEAFSILAENAPEIGADRAISFVPEGDPSPCAVIEDTGSRTIIAVLPCEQEAARVARHAIRPDGGYGSVTVEKTTERVTAFTFEEWLYR